MKGESVPLLPPEGFPVLGGGSGGKLVIITSDIELSRTILVTCGLL